MNVYVIAIASLFDNDNKLYKVEAENEIDAMLKALLASSVDSTEGILEWWNNMNKESIESIRGEFFNSDLLVSAPLKIN